MTGLLTSSLHRLKAGEPLQESGFFVFGDISVCQMGEFKLQYNLFELRGLRSQEPHVVFLTTLSGGIINITNTKSYPGLESSTFLSRSFSDQGVRLRLRKETRTPNAKKRSIDEVNEGEDDQDPNYRG
ncbi:hypothetical protein BT63DRAFT_366062 [Microthyrium microscopicum]|uniref:Velvet domain-containing protein n=1 Tax=Microthyrium microscopicum TaxID=703497 RepID=A0A6A6URJ0_9PEZI|nr:hypothetical protein BT63DRAFT_366062 [Microthyrium microscopicum]